MGCHAIDIGGGCLSCRVGANRADGALYQLEVLQLLIPELPKRIEGNLGIAVPGCGTFRNERIVKTHSGAFKRKPAAEFVDKRFRILASQFLHCRACGALERSWGGNRTHNLGFGYVLFTHIRKGGFISAGGSWSRGAQRQHFLNIDRGHIDPGAIESDNCTFLHDFNLLVCVS
jgi:hypothetical protein